MPNKFSKDTFDMVRRIIDKQDSATATNPLLIQAPSQGDWKDTEEFVEKVSNSTPPALTYSEFPKWLQHKILNPVIVYDKDQEAEHMAQGYFAAGSSDPHGYLVAKATEKMDDAIRTMNADVERKVAEGLVDLYNKLCKAMKEEIRLSRRMHKDYDEIALEENMDSLQDKFVGDIMDTIRASAKGTN